MAIYGLCSCGTIALNESLPDARDSGTHRCTVAPELFPVKPDIRVMVASNWLGASKTEQLAILVL